MRFPAARLLLVLLRAVVTAAALWLVLRHYGIEWISGVVTRLDPRWMAAGMLLAVAQVFLLAWRWRLLCTVLTGTVPQFRTVLLGLARSLLLGQLLPATVGSDAVRATSLAREAGAAGAVRSVISDRLLALLALLLLVAAELPLFAREAPGPAGASLAVASLAALAAVPVLLLLRRPLRRIPFLGRVAGVVADDLWLTLQRPRGCLGFGLGFLSHLTSALIFIAFVRSADGAVPLVASALVILPALLVVSVPVSLGGWGVREAAITTGFSLLGADAVTALTPSILFGLSGPLSGAVIELLALLAHANGLARSGAP